VKPSSSQLALAYTGAVSGNSYLVSLDLDTSLKTAVKYDDVTGIGGVSFTLLSLVGEPILRRGIIFQLSGITIEVAEECSGIHSSIVLFITSLLAGYLFLRTPWKRAVLTLAVIPLAILRNGFRIFTIAVLCVHVDPATSFHHSIFSLIHFSFFPISDNPDTD